MSKKEIITSENCYDVPIIINNRNRYTFLKQMVNQLHSFGYKNIYVLDNASTYEPLLTYYKTINATVIYLNDNLGYKALWLSTHFQKFKNKHYVYSDPDILLQTDCPKDFVFQLYTALQLSVWKEKAGVALKIDDIPDHYAHKKLVLSQEKIFWENKINETVYDAPVDTTLALYKPYSFGNAEECNGLRVAGKLSAQHLTWYLNSEDLPEEELYYKQSIKKDTSVYSIK